jgi:hypothetical protein
MGRWTVLRNPNPGPDQEHGPEYQGRGGQAHVVWVGGARGGNLGWVPMFRDFFPRNEFNKEPPLHCFFNFFQSVRLAASRSHLASRILLY